MAAVVAYQFYATSAHIVFQIFIQKFVHIFVQMFIQKGVHIFVQMFVQKSVSISVEQFVYIFVVLSRRERGEASMGSPRRIFLRIPLASAPHGNELHSNLEVGRAKRAAGWRCSSYGSLRSQWRANYGIGKRRKKVGPPDRPWIGAPSRAPWPESPASWNARALGRTRVQEQYHRRSRTDGSTR